MTGLLASQLVSGQEAEEQDSACGFTEARDLSPQPFPPGVVDDSALDFAVTRIMQQIGLSSDFEIKASDEFDYAGARRNFFTSIREVLVNLDGLARLRRDTNSAWPVWAILAHEIGHHLNYHPLSREAARELYENQADFFSGFVLFQLGARPTEAILVFSVCPDSAVSPYPGRNDRIAEFMRGWNSAKRIVAAIRIAPSGGAPQPQPEDGLRFLDRDQDGPSGEGPAETLLKLVIDRDPFSYFLAEDGLALTRSRTGLIVPVGIWAADARSGVSASVTLPGGQIEIRTDGIAYGSYLDGTKIPAGRVIEF